MQINRRTAKIAVLLTTFVAIVGLLAGCAKSTPAASKDGAIPQFTIGTTTVVQSLDPALAYNKVLSAPMYQGLLALTESGELEPMLAESYTQPSPNVYTFKLRPDVKFWDGNPMTSADVVTSLNYYADPATGKGASSQYAGVESVTADDDHTVTITLKQPDVSFLQVLAWAGTIFEKSAYEQNKATFGAPGTLIQATGPFQVTSFDPNTGIEFKANPNYWGGPVNIDALSVKYFKTETSAALAFRTGEIDVAFPTEAASFASSSGAELRSTPANAMGIFGINVTQAPWDDIHVRRAAAYALNRESLIKALGSPATPLSTIILPEQLEGLASPGDVEAVLSSVPGYPYSLEKAKEEMAKSAHADGFSTTLTTSTSGYASQPVAEAIAGMLGKIGIDVEVSVLDPATWLKGFTGEKAAPIQFTTINIPSTDPNGFPSWMLGSKNIPAGGWNFAAYGPPAMDTLLAQGTAETDTNRRLVTYGQVLDMVGTDVPYIPLFSLEYSMAMSPEFDWPGFNGNYARTNWLTEVVAR